MKQAVSIILLVLVSRFTVWPVMAQADCSGAPPPRLVVGAQGRVTPGDPNNVRDQPARAGALIGAIPGGAAFDVLDGPVCADGFNWWRVTYEGLDGWTVEGAGSDYWVEPVSTPTPTATFAPAAVFEPPVAAVNTLAVGVTARVINDDPNAASPTLLARAEPGRNASVVKRVSEGERVIVTGGPQETDGYRWWQIETADGARGWVIEGLYSAARSAYERTLLPVCPADGARRAYRVGDYIVTNNEAGDEPCVLDYLAISDVHTFWGFFFYFPNRFVPSPDGQYFLYMDTTPGTREYNLYRLSRDGGERRALTQGGGVNWAAWSPDGERIAVSRLPQIWIMRSDGSLPAALTTGSRPKPWVTWLPDSETVVYLEQASSHSQVYKEIESVFYRINVRQGGLREVLRTTLDVRDAEVSPDGRLLAVAGWLWSEQGEPEDDVIWVIDMETGERVLDSSTGYEAIIWTPDSRALVLLREAMQLDVVPLDGSEPAVFELDYRTLPRYLGFSRWLSDATFLAVGDDESLWTVDITTGGVEAYQP